MYSYLIDQPSYILHLRENITQLILRLLLRIKVKTMLVFSYDTTCIYNMVCLSLNLYCTLPHNRLPASVNRQ
jgi:hypothetical protein